MSQGDGDVRSEELAKRAMEIAARAEELSRRAHDTAGLDDELARLEAELERLDGEQAQLDAEFERAAFGNVADEAAADGAVADEGTADEGIADEGTADEGIADEGTADEGIADEGAADGVGAHERSSGDIPFSDTPVGGTPFSEAPFGGSPFAGGPFAGTPFGSNFGDDVLMPPGSRLGSLGWADSFAQRLEALGDQLGEFIGGTLGSTTEMGGLRETLELSSPVAGPVPIRVDSDGGRLDVVAGAADRVVVHASRRRGGTPLADLLDVAEVDGAVVVVCHEPRRLWARSGTHLRLEVPPGFPVTLRTGGGSVVVSGTEAPVTATTGGGPVTITDAIGSVVLRTGGGQITVDNLDGEVVARTGGGGIRVRGRLRGDSELRTGGGGVTVSIDPRTRITVNARGTGGRADVPGLRADHRGVFGEINGGGEGELTITTGGGTIRIEQR